MTIYYLDVDALVKARKGLSVAFIILTVFINFFLIVKTARRGRTFQNPKSLTVISLALGDVFLALFPSIVQTLIFYGSTENLTCGITAVAFTYTLHLIPFVYGTGLILLAAELLYRSKKQPEAKNITNNVAKNIAYSATHWIIGLVIVLPLTMVGACDQSISTDRSKTIIAVSVLLPASLAVILCAIVMCMKLSPFQFVYQDISYQNSTPNVALETRNNTRATQMYPTLITASPVMYYNQHENEKPKYRDQNSIPHGSIYSPPQHNIQHQQFNMHVSNQAVASVGSTIADPRREKILLFIVSIVFFLCVVPLSAYTLVNVMTQVSINPKVYESFFWLFLFRSIITPIIWIGVSKN